MTVALPPFQSFFDEHHRPVYAFLCGMVGRDAAEDCLQETFAAALRRYPEFDGRRPRAWILRIARNKAVDHARASARRPAADAGVDHLEAPQFGGNGFDGEVWRRVAVLPEGQRAAVLLRFSGDLSYRAIADALGCSEGAARRRVADALASLRNTLAAEEVL